MRFDDSFETVLASDVDSGVAAQSTWRQIVDLVARGRAPFDDRARDKLEALRPRVPRAIRVASVQTLEWANPPATLVEYLAVDDVAVALPLLRGAQLSDATWIALLPALTPPARAVMRNRRDLSPAVLRALDAFGSVDLVLGDGAPARGSAQPVAKPSIPRQSRSFVSLGSVAFDMPVVAEAVRRAEDGRANDGPFEIAEVVARIDAFQRQRAEEPPVPFAAAVPIAAATFRFETNRDGVITWVDGINRGATIGLALARPDTPGTSATDAVISGALRRRAGFRDARLRIDGSSEAGGDWLLSGIPLFDPASGRFLGYRGTARRPRAGDRASAGDGPPAESMRQLVHELRTPANAISGFAEMIESEILGPVPAVYRERAKVIRDQSKLLVGAIDDLDLAARIEGDSLELRPQPVAIAALMRDVARDLEDLLALRGAAFEIRDDEVEVDGDRRAIERLIGRLFATLAASAQRDERLMVRIAAHPGAVEIEIARPAGLDIEALDAAEGPAHDAVLLGADFALRLARNLARELGGRFDLLPDRLRLALPAVTRVAASEGSGHHP
ncbi:sensor histidine kinase [Sphingomonas sp. AX6]|uniref:sensor histidine kinase n=1 Tax=Sphingomonas sp. AX6 TaxID=2653171 RepID=UPI001F30CCA8|nr:HAMP domain-containing sensor histidine kinase [Sphingomonas sp. AX6]